MSVKYRRYISFIRQLAWLFRVLRRWCREGSSSIIVSCSPVSTSSLWRWILFRRMIFALGFLIAAFLTYADLVPEAHHRWLCNRNFPTWSGRCFSPCLVQMFYHTFRILVPTVDYIGISWYMCLPFCSCLFYLVLKR